MSFAKHPLLNEVPEELFYREADSASAYCRSQIERYRRKGRAETKRIVSLAKKIAKSDLPNRELICQSLFEALSPNHLDEPTVRQFYDYRIGESFTGSMVTQTAIERALWVERHKSSPERVLGNKIIARSFAKSLGLTLPGLLQCNVPASEIAVREGTVVKPCFASASKGVFVIKNGDCVLDLKNRELIGEAELRSRIALLLSTGTIRKDRWQIEELVTAKFLCQLDVKFYCFYGRVALVLEARRYPEVRYNWYNAGGDQITTGSDEGLEFNGEGVTAQEIASVAEISLEIPVPFIRVDFLRSEDGSLVFGEFTPRPGEFHTFNSVTDSSLGREYNAALARLNDDILMGKSFAAFPRQQGSGLKRHSTAEK